MTTIVRKAESVIVAKSTIAGTGELVCCEPIQEYIPPQQQNVVSAFSTETSSASNTKSLSGDWMNIDENITSTPRASAQLVLRNRPANFALSPVHDANSVLVTCQRSLSIDGCWWYICIGRVGVCFVKTERSLGTHPQRLHK